MQLFHAQRAAAQLQIAIKQGQVGAHAVYQIIINRGRDILGKEGGLQSAVKPAHSGGKNVLFHISGQHGGQ